MIAADTSSMIAYFQGETGEDTEIIDESIENNTLLLPPAVVAELISDPLLSKEVLNVILSLPIVTIREGYWVRVGQIRSLLLARKFKARLIDSMIAQSCMDFDIPLITRDEDFRHFEKYCGLKLA